MEDRTVLDLSSARRRIAELEATERTYSVLSRLATLADHNPSAVVEIEPDGAVAYRNHTVRDMFPGLDSLGIDHPLLAGVRDIADNMKSSGLESFTREVHVGDRTFSQKVLRTPDHPQISVYSDDITQQKTAQRALEVASAEAELLADENALLAEVGRIITSSLDIDDVYEGFAQQVRRLIPFDRIAISMIDFESGTFTNEYVLGVFAAGRERGSRVSISGTMIGYVIEHRDAIILQGDMGELSLRFPSMVRSGLKSVLAAPILFKNEMLGVLHLRSVQPDAYNSHHLDLIRKVAAQMAPAIANSQLYAQHTAAEAEANRLALQNAAIAEIGRIISSSLEIEEVYAGFAEQTRNLIPFHRISITLVRPDSEEFMTAYVVGPAVPGRRVGDVSLLVGTFSEKVRRRRRAMIFNARSKDDLITRFPGLSLEYDIGFRSFLSVPLIYNDAVIGVLNFRSLDGEAYAPYDVEIAELIGAQVAGAIASSQLHAETVAADLALQRQAVELVRSNADLEQFAYVASHDLQEPLRVIAGYVQLLEERYGEQLDQDARDFIGFAVDATHRMRTLINDLLEYSRVESHGNPFEPTDCNRALAEAMADLELSITETGAAITADPLPEVVGDPVQIAHLLENLIANAIKFRRDDLAPRIHVSCKRSEDTWQISVADNGIGIRTRYQDRIFGMFKRAHKRSKYPGTGIGLALCTRIVERHGGRIWVESEIGEGSTFRFTIPTSEEAYR